MKTIKTRPVWLLIPALALFVGYSASTWLGAARTDSIKPHTVTWITEWPDPHGTVTLSDTTIEAVRSDGSVAEHETRIGHRKSGLLKIGSRSIRDTAGRRNVFLREISRSISTVPMDDAQYERLTTPRDFPCAAANATTVVEENPEPARILGFKVVKVTTEYTVGSHPSAQAQLRVIRYLAPELNCKALRETQFYLDDNGDVTWSPMSREAVSAAVGEPPAELFAVPEAGYVERAPSEALRLFGELTGEGECRSCTTKAIQQQDKRYHDLRRQAGWN